MSTYSLVFPSTTAWRSTSCSSTHINTVFSRYIFSENYSCSETFPLIIIKSLQNRRSPASCSYFLFCVSVNVNVNVKVRQCCDVTSKSVNVVLLRQSLSMLCCYVKVRQCCVVTSKSINVVLLRQSPSMVCCYVKVRQYWVVTSKSRDK